MKSFNVIWWAYNDKKPEPFDIIPYLVDEYKDSENKPKTFEEFKEFIKHESMYRWWSRCQYEIIIKRWPPTEEESKWDIHMQVMMNLDTITNILMEVVKE